MITRKISDMTVNDSPICIKLLSFDDKNNSEYKKEITIAENAAILNVNCDDESVKNNSINSIMIYK